MRARAFHILEPKGTVDMLIIFLEERSEGSPPLLDSAGVSTVIYVKLLCVCTVCLFLLPIFTHTHTGALKIVHI